MDPQWKGLAVTTAVVAVLYLTGLLWSIVHGILVLGFGAVGLYCGVAYSLNNSKRYYPSKKPLPVLATTRLFTEMSEARSKYQPPERKVVTTHNLDNVLQEISELVVDEFVMSWYKDLGQDSERIKALLINDIWSSIEMLSSRLSNVDMVNLLTNDIVEELTNQFASIRRANTNIKGPHEHFALYPWLANSHKELGLLRQLAEVCVIHLLPPEYSGTPAATHFSRELVATCVFQPTVDMLCDPDYINQKLYNWLEYREKLSYEHRRTYTAAATYEEYMKIIEDCKDIEHLKQMRYNIMSEIIHATSIQNLKRMKGEDSSKEIATKSTSKGDLLRARNLTRYLNQLSVCKQFCEKRIHFHGGPDYKSYDDMPNSKTSGKKILAFSVIMDCAEARTELNKFLKRSDQDSLGLFWSAVNDLKSEPVRERHHSGSKIYQMYITHPSSTVRAILDRATIKGMEAFLMGNSGPEAFYTAQQVVYSSLEEKHYPSFIISDIYDAFTATFEMNELTGMASHPSPTSKDSPILDPIKKGVKERELIEEHSEYAQGKLKDLDDKIINKTRALQAMKSSQKPDTKIVKLQQDLRTEIDSLKAQRRQLDFHIERTTLWVDNRGKWTATICNHEMVDENKRKVLVFAIVVSPSNISAYAETQGWVIARKLEEFRLMHRKLYQIDPGLKKFKLPNIRRVKVGGEAAMQAAKDKLQEYLRRILSSDLTAQSETVYIFFSQSPEHLKYPGSGGQKIKGGTFSVTSIFQRVDQGDDSDSDDELMFADDESARDISTKDSIAGPFYELIQEICEVKGVFKWFRRTFIVFVKVTFGKSVNRQLYSLVNWLYCEPMLIYYLRLFRESYWPENAQRQPLSSRPEAEKIKTRYLAKTKIMENMPEAVKNLVGDLNAKRGAIKAFEAFQDERLNKQLFYTFQELLVKEIIPEIQDCSKVSHASPLLRQGQGQRQGRGDVKQTLHNIMPLHFA